MTWLVKSLLCKQEELSSDSQYSCKSWAWQHFRNPVLGWTDRQIPGAHQPASLAERAPAALSFIVLNKAGSPEGTTMNNYIVVHACSHLSVTHTHRDITGVGLWVYASSFSPVYIHTLRQNLHPVSRTMLVHYLLCSFSLGRHSFGASKPTLKLEGNDFRNFSLTSCQCRTVWSSASNEPCMNC